MKNLTQLPLLIIEDSLEDYTAMERALRKMGIENPIYHCQDGEEALDSLLGTGAYARSKLSPGLILLDLNLPGTDGREVLFRIKSDPDLKGLPVIVFSTSTHEKDINDCYQKGANCYLQKPLSYADYLDIVARMRDFWLNSKFIFYPAY